MSTTPVEYYCSFLDKKITVTETYEGSRLTKIECSGRSACMALDKCKFFGKDNPNLYIDAPYA